MPATFTLRAVDASDDAFLFQLYESTREDIASALPPGLQRELLMRMQWMAQQRDYAARYEVGGHQIVLVDGAPAGRLWVGRGAGEVRLVDVALLPRFRGAGLGAALVRGLQTEALAAGLPLRLSVRADNPARRLYERLGFTLARGAGQDAGSTHLAMEWAPTER
ncbi:GNAT family N-acetyltransferase [Myxococcaceae bacterium GXIMD 01537]